MVTLSRHGALLLAETEPKDSDYLRVVVQEALISLKNAVVSIQDANPGFTISESTGAATAAPVLRALTPANIVIGLRPGSKEEVIRAMVDTVAASGDLRDPALALEDILAREKTMTTGLGKGIATPHAKTEAVDKLVLALGICGEGTDFAALDGAPTRYVALILSPKGEEGPHLQVLSMITGLLNRQALRTGLDEAKTPEAAYQLLRFHASRWWTKPVT